MLASRGRSRSAERVGLLLAIFWLLSGPVAVARADELADLKAAPIWGLCESYFDKIKTNKSLTNYQIRDLSLEFLRLAKDRKPRTKREYELYAQCVNFASGNGHRAEELIQKSYDEDDEFFNDALVEAKNNANLSQFKYTGEVKNKYNLHAEVQIAKESFKTLVDNAAAEAMREATQIFGLAAGAATIAALSSRENSNGAANMASFAQFANLSNQVYSMNNAPARGGAAVSSPQIATSMSNVTLAPVRRESAPGSSGNASAAVVAAPTAATTTAAVQPATAADLVSARHLDAKCIRVNIRDEYGSIADITNACGVPIAVRWCWLKDLGSSCTPDQQSSIIDPKEGVRIPGPGGTKVQGRYVVCDMTDSRRICGN